MLGVWERQYIFYGEPTVMEVFVENYFGFLVDQYGFVPLDSGLGYKKGDLEIEFYSGKGEVDIVLFVRRDDDVFRPYVSRSFDFVDVLRRYAKHYEGFFEQVCTPSRKDVDAYLAYCSEQVRRYGEELLKGDVSMLEKIHLARRGV